jgi:hypothetical protein
MSVSWGWGDLDSQNDDVEQQEQQQGEAHIHAGHRARGRPNRNHLGPPHRPHGCDLPRDPRLAAAHHRSRDGKL